MRAVSTNKRNLIQSNNAMSSNKMPVPCHHSLELCGNCGDEIATEHDTFKLCERCGQYTCNDCIGEYGGEHACILCDELYTY